MKTIVDLVKEAGNFTTLVKAVEVAGMVEAASSPEPFTVLSPTDEAFAKLPPAAVEGLLKDPAKVQGALTYHLVPGKLLAGDLAKVKSVKTLQGAELTVDASGGELRNNGVKVTEADLVADNRVVHDLEGVLMPK